VRDHRKLEVFQLADRLTIAIYQLSQTFPPEERFGLSSQLRRAAVSVATNIVEGAARTSDRDFVRFLVMAYGSACEVGYQLDLSLRLGISAGTKSAEAAQLASRACRALRALIIQLRQTRHKRKKSGSGQPTS
jgi:four helix bundle protein